MNGFDDEFMEYLKANHPDDFDKVSSPDVKPETLARVFSNYSNNFDTWKKVPIAIRNKYSGRIPLEIMELAAEGETHILQKMAEYDVDEVTAENIIHEENCDHNPACEKCAHDNCIYQQFNASMEEIVSHHSFTDAINAGMSEEFAGDLINNLLHRSALTELLNSGNLSDTEKEDAKKTWLETRQNDIDTLKKSYSNDFPERMLVHVCSKYNAGKIEKEEFVEKVAELVQKIDTCKRQSHLIQYLEKTRVGNKIAKFRSEVREALFDAALSNVPANELPAIFRKDSELLAQNTNTASTKTIAEELQDIVQKYNNQTLENPLKSVNELVKRAKSENTGIDLTNIFTNDNFEMPKELNQMMIVSCYVHEVAYSGAKDDRLNLNSNFVQSLPNDVQSLLVARGLNRANQKLGEELPNTLSKNTIINNIPSSLARGNSRELS